jgi:hypothetical protein
MALGIVTLVEQANARGTMIIAGKSQQRNALIQGKAIPKYSSTHRCQKAMKRCQKTVRIDWQ